jgi:ribonuclease BN (tRNA processing enzyme)
MFKVKFFGVRGVYPCGGQQMNSVVVTTDDGPFLIDIGSPLIFDDERLMRNLDHILITHHHPDHIAFLASLIIYRLSVLKSSGRTGNSCRFVSPHSVREYMERSGISGIETFTETAKIPSEWRGLKLSGMVTRHPVCNYAYKLQSGRTTMVYTGDTTYSPELANFCRGADFLIIESSFPDIQIEDAIRWGHMCPQLTARLLNEAMPATTVLTHFIVLPPEEYRAEVLSLVKGQHNIIYAYDGLELELER